MDVIIALILVLGIGSFTCMGIVLIGWFSTLHCRLDYKISEGKLMEEAKNNAIVRDSAQIKLEEERNNLIISRQLALKAAESNLGTSIPDEWVAANPNLRLRR